MSTVAGMGRNLPWADTGWRDFCPVWLILFSLNKDTNSYDKKKLNFLNC